MTEPVDAASPNWVREGRPGVALINNSLTPYRLHVHRRIARELPQIKLWSFFTHDHASANWKLKTDDEINPILFGPDQAASEQSMPRHAIREWRKGGKMVDALQQRAIRAVVVGGYNDVGRLRVIRWCARNGVPCFLFADSNIRGDRLRGPTAWIKRAIVQKVVSACSGILVCGRLGAEYFAKYGATADRIFFFPYEPDYRLIEEAPRELLHATRDDLHFSEARRRIIYSGRLIAIKRVDMLIDAFAEIADRRPNWDLVIVGDGALRQTLMRQADNPANHREGDSKARVMWAGFIDDAAILAAIYRCGDVLVLPSDVEPWAVVVNEAAAAGLAIIATSVVGAAYELVRDGVNGRIIPPGRADALRDALLDVTEDSRIDAYKHASPEVLREWRKMADPIAGLRAALRSANVLN